MTVYRTELDLLAEARKKLKKTFSEEAKKRKIESKQARDRTRVNLRLVFTYWHELKDAK